MSLRSSGYGSIGESDGDPSVELRRYLAALRRNVWLIAAIVVVMCGTVLGLSLRAPKVFEAQAQIVLHDTSVTSDSGKIRRQLATTQTLLLTREVAEQAQLEVPGAAEDPPSLSTSVDEEADIVYVVARGGDPEVTADYANAVASTFIESRAESERRRLARARAALEEELKRVQTLPEGDTQAAVLRERPSQLTVTDTAVGADLEIAEPARPSWDAVSPRPLRNTVFALFAALFVGVLVALGRDQLVPRVSGAREIARLLHLPLLAGIPYARRGLRRRRLRLMNAVEEQSYSTLAAALELASTGQQQRVILVTAALRGEGKTTATAQLGRALARAGRRTLVISADVRIPTLHEYLGLPNGLGLTDVLMTLDRRGEEAARRMLPEATHLVSVTSPENRRGGYLHAMTSGTPPKDPAALMSVLLLRPFLRLIEGIDYDYVLLDSPPLLGLADSQVMAQAAGETLVVCRPSMLRLENVVDLRDHLTRLDANPIGMVAIGVEAQMSPYYEAMPDVRREIQA